MANLSNAKFKNYAFHLALSPPFTIFATNTAITSDDGLTELTNCPKRHNHITTENLLSAKPQKMNGIIKDTGDYKRLLSYQKTDVIYQITYYFCHSYLTKGDRTVDQMVQAARSGKQNIIEGCAASATSAKTEIKLVNVAKASLKELIEDYEDYLKTRHHRQWEPDSPEFAAMRQLGAKHNDAEFFMNIVSTRPPETIANMAIILLKQADYLLHRQLQRLEADFINNGGFSERMAAARRQKRGY